jgi:DNA modification methylase
MLFVPSDNYKLSNGDYKEVLDGSFDLIFTSPPYNIGSKAPAKTGRRKYGGYDAKSFRSITDYEDDMPEDEYQDSQWKFMLWCEQHLSPNGILVYNHKDRHKNGRLISPMSWFPDCLALKEKIIWDRRSTHNHCKQYLYQITEDIYVFTKPGAPYCIQNHDYDGGANIWRIPRVYKSDHNAPFPIDLANRVIKSWSKEGDLVCDPYSGSGTVMKACYNLNRRFIGSEKSPKYFKKITEEFSNLLKAA